MFGIGPLELVVITIVAVIFIGPDKLPDAMRKFGKFFVQIRRHANDVKGSFQEIIHDAERDLELEKIRELQAKLQNVSPAQMLDSAMKGPDTAAGAELPKIEAEPYDYHESHYVDGVYSQRGPDHVLGPDPILQPDPPPPSHNPVPMAAPAPVAAPTAGATAPVPVTPAPAAALSPPGGATPSASLEKKA